MGSGVRSKTWTIRKNGGPSLFGWVAQLINIVLSQRQSLDSELENGAFHWTSKQQFHTFIAGEARLHHEYGKIASETIQLAYRGLDGMVEKWESGGAWKVLQDQYQRGGEHGVRRALTVCVSDYAQSLLTFASIVGTVPDRFDKAEHLFALSETNGKCGYNLGSEELEHEPLVRMYDLLLRTAEVGALGLKARRIVLGTVMQDHEGRFHDEFVGVLKANGIV